MRYFWFITQLLAGSAVKFALGADNITILDKQDNQEIVKKTPALRANIRSSTDPKLIKSAPHDTRTNILKSNHNTHMVTPNQYKYLPVQNFDPSVRQVTFAVKAKNDAHIALGEDTNHNGKHYEIVLGGWGNTHSRIRGANQNPTLASYDGGVLHSEEDRLFRISWDNTMLKVEKATTSGWHSIMLFSGRDTSSYNWTINHMMISTGWGATGSWYNIAITSSFQPTPFTQFPTPNLSDSNLPTPTEPSSSEPTSSKPTSSEPTSSEPISSEPTSSEPTSSEPTSSEPTTSEPTSGEPEGNICALANKKNCQAVGCVLDGKDCNMCSTLSKESKKNKCTAAGCNRDGDADDQCWSCNTMDSKKDCAKASCVWADVKDMGEMCSPCASITKSKICKKACAYDKKADIKCSSCALLTSKEKCKKFKKGCAWKKGACVSKKA